MYQEAMFLKINNKLRSWGHFGEKTIAYAWLYLGQNVYAQMPEKIIHTYFKFARPAFAFYKIPTEKVLEPGIHIEL